MYRGDTGHQCTSSSWSQFRNGSCLSGCVTYSFVHVRFIHTVKYSFIHRLSLKTHLQINKKMISSFAWFTHDDTFTGFRAPCNLHCVQRMSHCYSHRTCKKPGRRRRYMSHSRMVLYFTLQLLNNYFFSPDTLPATNSKNGMAAKSASKSIHLCPHGEYMQTCILCKLHHGQLLDS